MLSAQTMGLLRPHEGLICRFSRRLRSAAALSDDEIDALMAPISKRELTVLPLRIGTQKQMNDRKRQVQPPQQSYLTPETVKTSEGNANDDCAPRGLIGDNCSPRRGCAGPVNSTSEGPKGRSAASASDGFDAHFADTIACGRGAYARVCSNVHSASQHGGAQGAAASRR